MSSNFLHSLLKMQGSTVSLGIFQLSNATPFYDRSFGSLFWDIKYCPFLNWAWTNEHPGCLSILFVFSWNQSNISTFALFIQSLAGIHFYSFNQPNTSPTVSCRSTTSLGTGNFSSLSWSSSGCCPGGKISKDFSSGSISQPI